MSSFVQPAPGEGPPQSMLNRSTIFTILIALGLSAGGPCSVARAQQDVELAPAEARRLAPSQPQAPSDEDLAIDLGQAERFRTIRSSMRPEQRSEYALRLRPLEGFFDWDSEDEILYSPGRTQIYYGDYYLEADRVILDNRIQEVQAEGNVIFRTFDPEFEADEIRADSMRYNFAEGEGVAFNVEGRHPPVYFSTDLPKTPAEARIPQFQQISAGESLFRNTRATTCNFKIPHYRIRAREVILFTGDRMFFRGATFYVGAMPVLYLPFFSRSVTTRSPWYIRAGAGSHTGFRLRTGYEFSHETAEPTFEDESVYEIRSRGTAQTFTDVLSKRGFGAGYRYQYEFDFERHTGELQIYGIYDIDRETSSDKISANQVEEDEPKRWQFLWRNRTQITENLSALVNIDMFSDPEIFFDILDRFGDAPLERDRQIVRRARGALTYLREAYVARLLVELKDRIGINRFNDFSDPRDNNLDFDFDPGTSLDDSDSNSITRKRWGRVSERLPEFTFSTRYLPIRSWPLYLFSEVRAYNNLDKGLNIVSEDDDARVAGIDVYNQLLWQFRMTERYVLMAKLGGGVGAAERENDSLGIDFSGLTPDADGFFRVDALRFRGSDETFLIGTEDFNLDDIESFYAWVDAEVRLNARFSDALTGYLLWKIRETTNDFIGDFYARAGNVTAREDLFNYRLREHWIEANLTYRLFYPAMAVYLSGGLNLDSEADLFPSERVAFYNTGVMWANRLKTLRATIGVGGSRRQIFHESDLRSGDQDLTTVGGTLGYSPVHGRWYTRLRAQRTEISGETSELAGDRFLTFFTDEEDETRIDWVFGLQLGPKWEAEIDLEWNSRLDGFSDISVQLQRDLHDALAILRLRSRRDLERADDRNDNPREFDVSIGLKLKLPDQELAFGADEIKTLRQRERKPVLAY